MSDFATTFEQFEYAMDVLQGYTFELKNVDGTIDSVFILGKISAAMEELQIHYQCLSDVIFETVNQKQSSDVIKVGDTIPSVGAGDFINFSINDDVIDFSKGYSLKFNSDENNATE